MNRYSSRDNKTYYLFMFDSEKAREAGKKSSRKGTPNKLPRGVKDRIKEIVDLVGDKIDIDFQSLPPTERVKAWLSLLEFIEPKKSRVEADVNNNVRQITIGTPTKPGEKASSDWGDNTDKGGTSEE